MAFTVPPLAYPFDALEPHIDAKTMEIHHDKHHATYVANANAALEKHPELAAKTVEDLLWGIDMVPEDIRTAIRNNAGGHSNHSIFWSIMGPGGGGNPPGRLGDTIKSTFGGYDAFKEQLTKAAVGQFGSGWAWLLADKNGKMSIKSYPNQDSPFMEGLTPILGVDVWEHAYYLKYQNKRADYVAAWFNTLNWAAIEARFSSIWVS
ncbi:MAG TPA: superoxide dismutase [Candidatus Dormibacteraeota bacterium]|jgi:Fe-Mn family superoxide dismutase